MSDDSHDGELRKCKSSSVLSNRSIKVGVLLLGTESMLSTAAGPEVENCDCWVDMDGS